MISQVAPPVCMTGAGFFTASGCWVLECNWRHARRERNQVNEDVVSGREFLLISVVSTPWLIIFVPVTWLIFSVPVTWLIFSDFIRKISFFTFSYVKNDIFRGWYFSFLWRGWYFSFPWRGWYFSFLWCGGYFSVPKLIYFVADSDTDWYVRSAINNPSTFL